MPNTAVTHILLDPTSPVGKRTLYACGFGRGVYKSIDNGKTWTLKNNGIEKKQPFAWRLTRAEDGTLYLVCAPQLSRTQRRRYASRVKSARWRALVKMTPAGTNGPMAFGSFD